MLITARYALVFLSTNDKRLIHFLTDFLSAWQYYLTRLSAKKKQSVHTNIQMDFFIKCSLPVYQAVMLSPYAGKKIKYMIKKSNIDGKKNKKNHKTNATNIKLKEDEIKIYQWFSNSNDFPAFKQRITDQVIKLGFREWCYIRLDLPERQSVEKHIGTINSEHTQHYMAEQFYACDLMLHYARDCKSFLFQSQMETIVNQTVFTNSTFEQYKKLLTMNKKYGYYDTCCFPQKSKFGGMFMFIVTSPKVEPGHFRESVKKTSTLIKLTGKIVDLIGVTKFPESFIEAAKYYNDMQLSMPYLFLVTMAKNDFSIQETAKHYGISMSEARQILASIRELFGSKTNEGAYYKMEEAGYNCDLKI